MFRFNKFTQTEQTKTKGTYQRVEDEGEDGGEEAHEGNSHDDFEDVVFVKGLVLRDLDLFIQQEGTAKGVQHNHRLGRRHRNTTNDK